MWNPQDIDELYDLQTDPHETVNLIDEAASTETLLRLRNQLLVWLNAIGDDFPNRIGDLPPAGTIMKTGKMGP